MPHTVHRLMTYMNTLIYIIHVHRKYMHLGYEPGDLTVHPPPELPRVGSFFSYRCLVFPKKCPQRKACAFRIY